MNVFIYECVHFFTERVMTMKRNDFRTRIFSAWGKWSVKHARKAIWIAVILTVVLLIGASWLRLDMTYYSIMPGESKQVQQMKYIYNHFSSASSIFAVIDGRDLGADAEQKVKEKADDLVTALSEPGLSPYVDTAYARMDMDFTARHALMLTDARDIDESLVYSGSIANMLMGINTYLKDGGYTEDELNTMLRTLDTMLDVMDSGEQDSAALRKSLQDMVVGDGYMLNKDSNMAIVVIQPAFTMNDIAALVPGVDAIEKAVKDTAQGGGISAGITGLTVVGRDEMVTSEQGLLGSMVFALLLIMVLMILVFRFASAPVISAIPLIAGILWTVGITGYSIHRLNIMTAMYMVALMGLGIDYAIHQLTVFRQERDQGASYEEAIVLSMEKSGPPILTGGATTAIAFFALTLGKTQLLKEIGTVAGIGIVCEMAAMLLLIPSILALRGKRMERKGITERTIFSKVYISAKPAMGVGRLVKKAPIVIMLLMLAMGITLSSFAPKVEVEQNLMNMEAKGLTSIELQDVMTDQFGMSVDGLALTVNSIEETAQLTEKLEKLSTVKAVDSIAPYYVTDTQYIARKEKIDEVKSLIDQGAIEYMATQPLNADEIKGYLEDINAKLSGKAESFDDAYLQAVIERLSGPAGRIRAYIDQGIDGGKLNDLQDRIYPRYKDLLLKMCNTDTITPEDIPQDIRDSYVSNDGSQYLLSVFPAKNIWDPANREKHMAELTTVTDEATGMILASNELNRIVDTDGLNAALAAFIAILVILLIDFRNIKLTVMTVMPLALSMGSLLGVMAIFHIKFDFINIISIPLLIGIGIDDAVHINHRYLQEGHGNIDKTIAATGSAVLLTTLTTIIGFASFIPAIMRAMRSTGIVLSIAMALAFLFSILMHPAMLVLVHEKLGGNIRPIGEKRKR